MAMTPPRTVHKCNKEREITDLTLKVNKMHDAYFGNGDGQPGMKVNVALLAEKMDQVAKTLGVMSPDMTMIKEYITAKKAAEDRDEKEQKKKSVNWNTFLSAIVAAAAVVALIISIKAMKG